MITKTLAERSPGIRNSESTTVRKWYMVSAQPRGSAATPASSAPTAPFFFFPLLVEEFDDDDEAVTRGPLHGEDSFCAVRFTGAGTLEAVKLVSRPEAMNTGPPPAPTADVFGAVKGT